MNKLITKIVGVTLGLGLAVGVSAGVAISNKAIEPAFAAAVGGTDTINSSKLDLSSIANTTWDTGSISSNTSDAVYSYRLMGTKNTSDGRMGGTNANGGVWTTSSGGTLSSVTVTTVTAKALDLYGGTAAFTAYNDTSGRTKIGTGTTSGSGSNYSYTWSNLASSGYTHVLLKGTASSTFIKSIVFVWNAPSSEATITLGASSLVVATTTQKTLSVDYSNLTANITVSQTSSNGGAVTLSTNGTNYSSSLTLNRVTASPQTVYVKGSTAGTVTLSFASTGVTTKNCTVTVSTPTVFKKVTKTASVKSGGSFLLVATGTSIAMSKTQLTNGRDPANIDIVSNDVHLPSSYDAAVLKITKGTGTYSDYYTIFDPAYSTNGGYLEYYSSNLTCYYVSSTPNNDAYYWSLSFSNDHVVLENKSNPGNYIEYNAANNAKYFRLYAGTQTKIDLYELESDIPSSTSLTSITAENLSVGSGATVTYTGSYLPANATEAITATLSSTIASLSEVTMNNGEFSITITAGNNAGSATMTLVGENGHGSTTVTITVTSFTATHNLVTNANSLSNGAKIVIASQSDADNSNYSGSAHTGGNFLPVTPTAFNSSKTALSAADDTQEFTIWCVDSSKGYYVLSDGGYYMAAAENTNNYLQRVDVLSSRCYFTIANDADGIVLTSYYSVEQGWKYNNNPVSYTLQYNYNGGTNSRIALYRADSQTAASLFLSTQSVNAVQGFVDVFLHFGNIAKTSTNDTNACRSEGSNNKGYFDAALSAYAGLSSSEKEAFCTNSAYADAYARLSAWAAANGYSFDGYSLVQGSRMNVMNVNNNNVMIIVIITSVIAVSAVGAIFLLRKKKEER